MTIAFDAVTGRAEPADDSFTHTPVGTPRAVLAIGVQNTAADQVLSITYGGTEMTELGSSPFLGTAGDEDQTIYAYFLGASVPTGAQNVIVDTSGSAAKRFTFITVTAAADVEVDAILTRDAVEQNPSLTLATTASTNTFVVGQLGSGVDGTADLTPGADFTQLVEGSVSAGRQANSMYRTTNPTGGNVTVDWTTAASDDAHIYAVALREVGGAPPAAPTLWSNTTPLRW